VCSYFKLGKVKTSTYASSRFKHRYQLQPLTNGAIPSVVSDVPVAQAVQEVHQVATELQVLVQELQAHRDVQVAGRDQA